MWIRVIDDGCESCINLDYISCFSQEGNSIKLVFSDGSYEYATSIRGYTYDSLCELLTKRE